MCSLSYSTCNVHAPYCHLHHARLYRIFPHYLINDTILRKPIWIIKLCTFWFSVQLVSETFLILRKKWTKFYHKCAWVFMQSIRYSCHILIELQFSIQIVENPSNIRFYENTSRGSRCSTPRGGWTYEVNSCFSQFCERVQRQYECAIGMTMWLLSGCPFDSCSRPVLQHRLILCGHPSTVVECAAVKCVFFPRWCLIVSLNLSQITQPTRQLSTGHKRTWPSGGGKVKRELFLF